ncbi:methyltransferase domain-containing protein [Mycobacterium sp. 20091114027_K0903767]|nr:methyltransferase domain-containing protein [Mycobacterium sp. 20091114027_K0903767]
MHPKCLLLTLNPRTKTRFEVVEPATPSNVGATGSSREVHQGRTESCRPVVQKGEQNALDRPPGSSDGGLFAGTAWHYARYRPGYPREFLDDLIQRLGLDGIGRLLELGCDTGQLTLLLADHVVEAVGMDHEPDMLAEASRQAQDAAVTNVSWIHGNSADFPDDLGHFTLFTIGRSFHWMVPKTCAFVGTRQGRLGRGRQTWRLGALLLCASGVTDPAAEGESSVEQRYVGEAGFMQDGLVLVGGEDRHPFLDGASGVFGIVASQARGYAKLDVPPHPPVAADFWDAVMRDD